jgi:hypothetical protein
MKTTFNHLLWLCAALLLHFSIFAQTVQHPNADRDLKLAQERRVAYNKGDWKAFEAGFTADAMAYNVNGKDSLTAAEWIVSAKADRATMKSIAIGNGPILPLNIAEGPFSGDWIFEWNDHMATYKNGKKVSFPYHIACHLKDGKIDQIRFYADGSRIMQQQGWTMTPPKQ